MMRAINYLWAGVASAVLLGAAPAGASIVLSGAPINLAQTGNSQGAIVIDFNSSFGQSGAFSIGPYSFSGDGAVVGPPSVSGSYASPSGDATPYLSTGFTGSAGTKTEVLTLDGLHNYFGLYWGSIDSYNTIEFYQGATLVGSITGNMVGAPANGNQADGNQNRYVNIVSNSALTNFDSIRFVTGSPAFEVDNFALTAAVPEASTWAMMILGFLGVGFFGYRKSSKASGRALRIA
jgi:hypothetical protein